MSRTKRKISYRIPGMYGCSSTTRDGVTSKSSPNKTVKKIWNRKFRRKMENEELQPIRKSHDWHWW